MFGHRRVSSLVPQQLLLQRLGVLVVQKAEAELRLRRQEDAPLPEQEQIRGRCVGDRRLPGKLRRVLAISI